MREHSEARRALTIAMSSSTLCVRAWYAIRVMALIGAKRSGDQAFFLDDEPTPMDVTGCGFVASLLWVPIDLPIRAHAQKLLNLAAYCQRMKARYFQS